MAVVVFLGLGLTTPAGLELKYCPAPKIGMEPAR
jgi:hypothetical protein